MIVGVSLKAYFGHAQTLAWAPGRRGARIEARDRRWHGRAVRDPVVPGARRGRQRSWMARPSDSARRTCSGRTAGPTRVRSRRTSSRSSGCPSSRSGMRSAGGCSTRRMRWSRRSAPRHPATASSRCCASASAPAAPSGRRCRCRLRSSRRRTRRMRSWRGSRCGRSAPTGRPSPSTSARCATGCANRSTGVGCIYGGSAGPGLITELARSVDGLFLGRSAHDVKALADVIDEAAASSLAAQ